MKIINNLEEMKPYYRKRGHIYNFMKKDVEFTKDIEIDGSLKARNISAKGNLVINGNVKTEFNSFIKGNYNVNGNVEVDGCGKIETGGNFIVIGDIKGVVSISVDGFIEAINIDANTIIFKGKYLIAHGNLIVTGYYWNSYTSIIAYGNILVEGYMRTYTVCCESRVVSEKGMYRL